MASLLLALACNPAPEPRVHPSADTRPQVARRIYPCRVDRPDARAAEAGLRRIDEAIKGLSPLADPAPILHAISVVNASPCLADKGKLGFDQEGVKRPDSALSLQEFWTRGGGREWIDEYLNPRPLKHPASLLYGEPYFRKTLSRESAPVHPLVQLLCSAADSGCIATAEPFRRRAAEYLKLAAERSLRQVSKAVPADCLERIGALPEAKRRDAWIDCFEATELRPFRFPLVGLPRLRKGWLLMSGRRGHYTFCDELRAYHLATGSAFVVNSCSGLEFSDTGGVDHRASDAGRAVRARRGVMPGVAVQEALWFLLMAPELERVSFARGAAYAGKVEREPSFTCSSQTELGWSYVLDDKPLARGSLTWDGCGYDTLNDYALQLVRFAEDVMDDGCPTARPPEGLLETMAPLDANGLDADEQSLDVTGAALARAWKELATRPACKPDR